MGEPFSIILLITILLLAIVLAIGVLQFSFGTRSTGENLIALAFAILVISIIESVVFPREIKEVRCIFNGTVNMTEIQNEYKIKSVTDDGVFVLWRKKPNDAE